MSVKRALWAVLALAACSGEGEVGDPGTIDVAVIDAERAPIADATVTTFPFTEALITDALGVVRLANVRPGVYTVIASHPAQGAMQAPARLASGGAIALELVLAHTRLPLPGAPNVEITAPASGTTIDATAPLTVSGVVSDDRDAASSLAIVWESNKDGVFVRSTARSDGVTTLLIDHLSAGPQVITLRATDSSGLESAANISLIVDDASQLPDPVVLDRPVQDMNGVVLTWSASTETRAFDYVVHRADGAGELAIVNVIPGDGERMYRDGFVQLGHTYRYAIGVARDGSESLSNMESVTIGESIDVLGSIEAMLVDPARRYLYALDRANEVLHLVNLDDKRIEKSIGIDGDPVDLDLDPSGAMLYIATFGARAIAVVDLETQELERSIEVETELGSWGGNPYRVAGTVNGTLVFTSEDQFNELKLVDVASGMNVAHLGSLYAPDLVASPDGTRIYAGESGSSSGELYRFDVGAGALTEVDRTHGANGDGTRKVLTGGGFVFYGGKKFAADDLSMELGRFPETIWAVSADGMRAIGSEHVFDGGGVVATATLPLVTTKMVLSADASTIYLFDPISKRLFIHPL